MPSSRWMPSSRKSLLVLLHEVACRAVACRAVPWHFVLFSSLHLSSIYTYRSSPDSGPSIFFNFSFFFIFFHFSFISFIIFSFFHFSFFPFFQFFIFLHFLSFSFIFFHVLSCSFMFFHVLSCSFMFFHVLSCSLSFYHFPSFSVIFCHCLFLSFFFFFFSGAQNPFFASIASRFLLKLFCKKSFFWAVSGGTPLGPFFLLSILTFFSFSFSFSITFHVFPLFFLFSFFIPLFSFYFPFKKCFFLFHFVSLFSFLGCSKSVAALQDSLVKSAHSELALFALYWLVVTFPCGIVHILVMIRLRVVHGGRRVGQVLPSYQNRQISALNETADAPQSSLPFPSLPFPSLPFTSLHFTSLPFPSEALCFAVHLCPTLCGCGVWVLSSGVFWVRRGLLASPSGRHDRRSPQKVAAWAACCSE